MLPTDPHPGELTERWSARNYAPLPVVLTWGEGSRVRDVEGREYLDFLAGYSALNFGHRHPRLVAAARRQLERVTLVSRAFDHDQYGPFCRDLALLCGKDLVLPMNTGAEAVETALKTARKWGYRVKGVAPDRATVVVARRQLPRPDDHAGVGVDRRGRARRPRPVHARLPAGALRRPARRRGGDRRDDGGRARRAGAGGGGRRRAAAGLPARAARAVHPYGGPARRRRGPERARSHGPDVRLRPGGRRAGRLRARQGARRRHPPGERGRRRRRRARRPPSGRARLHVRRQPAGLRGRPRGGRPAARGRAAGRALPGSGAAWPSASAGSTRGS